MYFSFLNVLLYYYSLTVYRKIDSTMSLYTDSESAQIGITTMFSILVSTDLIGNTIVGLVIILNRDMRYYMCCNLREIENV